MRRLRLDRALLGELLAEYVTFRGLEADVEAGSVVEAAEADVKRTMLRKDDEGNGRGQVGLHQQHQHEGRAKLGIRSWLWDDGSDEGDEAWRSAKVATSDGLRPSTSGGPSGPHGGGPPQVEDESPSSSASTGEAPNHLVCGFFRILDLLSFPRRHGSLHPL